MLTAGVLKFEEIRAEDAQWAEPAMRAAASPLCEHNFATIFLWRRYYRQTLTSFEGRPLVRSGYGDRLLFLFPTGPHWRADVKQLFDAAHAEGKPLILYGIAEAECRMLEENFPGRFAFSADRADADYGYRRADLAELPGKAYQKKRNHVAAFTRKFPWSYETLGDDNTIDALQMAERWYEEAAPLTDTLEVERQMLPELLAHRELLRLRGGLLRVNGEPVALTLASPVTVNTADVQFEKALSAHPGAYAVINQQFVQHELADMAFINRENDMGIEGLRKAKLSYHPVGLLEKYVAVEHR